MYSFDLLLLPKDILVDVFLRLPTKTLVLIASTSKTLYNFITNPSFITTHFNNSKKNPFIFLAFYNDSHEENDFGRHKFCLHSDDGSSKWDFNLIEMPFMSRGAWRFVILGFCNGVICLADEYVGKTHNVYLWNPCISRYFALPKPDVTFENYGPFDGCLGFGFDELTNDYKVVRITYLENYWGCDKRDLDPPFVEVYSMNSGSWRFVDYGCSSNLKIYIIRNYSQCFMEGVIHWLAHDYFSSVDYGVAWKAIVTFDVSDDSFGEIKLPASLEGSSSSKEMVTLYTCWDMLALINDSLERQVHCIWLMKEYGVVDSWTKMYSFTLSGCDLSLRAIGFRTNKDILLCMETSTWITNSQYTRMRHKDERAHIMFSAKVDGSMTELLGTIRSGTQIGFYLDSYEESLALLKEGKPTSTYVFKYKEVDDSDDVQGDDVTDGVVGVDEKEDQGLKSNDLLS